MQELVLLVFLYRHELLFKNTAKEFLCYFRYCYCQRSISVLFHFVSSHFVSSHFVLLLFLYHLLTQCCHEPTISHSLINTFPCHDLDVISFYEFRVFWIPFFSFFFWVFNFLGIQETHKMERGIGHYRLADFYQIE